MVLSIRGRRPLPEQLRSDRWQKTLLSSARLYGRVLRETEHETHVHPLLTCNEPMLVVVPVPVEASTGERPTQTTPVA